MSDNVVKDFQAWVEVDRRPLPEYDAQFDLESNTWTCWIPSEEGKSFVVHWRNFGRRVATTGGYVYVDGEFADGKLLFNTNNIQKTSVSGKRSSSAMVAPFTFQKITFTDDDTIPLEDERTVNDIGRIKVIINQGSYGGAVKYRHGGAPEAKPVHELSKKVGGHRVQYANKVKDTDSKGAVFEVDASVTPVTFIFQYRPRDLLQAMGIIDRGQAAAHPGAAVLLPKPEPPDDPQYPRTRSRARRSQPEGPVKEEPQDLRPPTATLTPAVKQELPDKLEPSDAQQFGADSTPSTSRGIKREIDDTDNYGSHTSGSRPRQRVKREAN